LTLKAENQKKEVEPDSFFYIQNEFQVRNKQNIDVNIAPVPDLVLEIDITRSSLDKFVIYGALGVPEIWRYNGKLLRVSLWNTKNKVYERSDYSRVFCWLKVND